VGYSLTYEGEKRGLLSLHPLHLLERGGEGEGLYFSREKYRLFSHGTAGKKKRKVACLSLYAGKGGGGKKKHFRFPGKGGRNFREGKEKGKRVKSLSLFLRREGRKRKGPNHEFPPAETVQHCEGGGEKRKKWYSSIL